MSYYTFKSDCRSTSKTSLQLAVPQHYLHIFFSVCMPQVLVSVQIRLLPITSALCVVIEDETAVITHFIPASLFIVVVSGLCSSACKALINNGCVCVGVSCMDCVTLSHVHTNPQELDGASDGSLLHFLQL